jgi:hypothetical protein
MRIVFGLASLINIIDMWDIRHTLFSNEGIIIHYPRTSFSITNYSIFYIQGAQSLSGVTTIFILSALASLCLTLGLFPRISAFLVYIWTISYVTHIPPVACGYEIILQTFALIILISPLHGIWSLSHFCFWKKKNGAPFYPISPRYGIILLQWQVFIIYWSTAFHKVIDSYWQKGETVFFYITSYFGRFSPEQVWEYRELLYYLSDATLAIEFALPFLLWNKKTRWLGFFLGIGFHVSIGILSRLSIFSIVILSTYVCFLDSDDLEKIKYWKKRLLG